MNNLQLQTHQREFGYSVLLKKKNISLQMKPRNKFSNFKIPSTQERPFKNNKNFIFHLKSCPLKFQQERPS